MVERILLDNEQWRLSLGMLGRFKVTLKHRGQTRKATREEGGYFLEMVKSLRGCGIPVEPNNPDFELAAEGFCEAIWGNDIRHKLYFSTPPHERIPTDQKKVDPLNDLYFKSVDAAFGYICQFMDTDLVEGHARPAIIVESQGCTVTVRLPNEKDGFINNYPIYVPDKFPNLNPGEFVMVGVDEVLSDGIEGVIVDIIAPHLIIDRGEWESTFQK